jgi:hypothetical protein
VVIRNNIFINPKRFFYAYHEDETFLNLIIDYNCYYKNEPLDTFTANYITQEITLVQNFDQYQEFSDYETNSIFEFPEFLNIGINPYQISSESPCVDAGRNVNVPTDHIGTLRPQGAAFDIGAYETINTSILEIPSNSSSFKVYPNPSSGDVYISDFGTFYNKQIEVSIFNLEGKLQSTSKNELNSKISLNLPSGTYLIQVKNTTKTETFTIVFL